MCHEDWLDEDMTFIGSAAQDQCWTRLEGNTGGGWTQVAQLQVLLSRAAKARATTKDTPPSSVKSCWLVGTSDNREI